MTWYVYTNESGEEYRTQIVLTDKQMEKRGLRFVRKEVPD